MELYKGGNVPIQEFIHMNYDNDILVAVHIVKTPVKITYLSQRNTATDFPVIAVAVSEYNEKTACQHWCKTGKGRDTDT